MFSGIIEETAKVVSLEKHQSNIDITLTCSFVSELKIDQSVAHNGVCLTVVRTDNATYTVTAMEETLQRSNLGALQVGDEVNVERSMPLNARLDGHIVQGHVDQTASAPRWRTWTEAQPLRSPTKTTLSWQSADISRLTKAVSRSTA